MKKTTLLALMISTAPFSAMADSVTGALTLSYTEHSEGSDSMDTKGLDGRLNVDMDNGLSFGFDIGRSNMSQTGVPVDFEAEFYSVDARYRFGNGFSAGVFADRLSMGIDLLPIDLTIKTNGFILGYETSDFTVEGIVGSTDVGFFLVVLPDVDIKNYGITGRYTGVEGLNVGATFLRAHLTDGTDSEDIDFAGVAGTYMVHESLMVFAGASSLDMSLGGDNLDAFGLGLSYDLSAQLGFASSVSFEYGQTSMGGDGLDVMRLGLTIPLGKAGPVLPMNSVADAILNPRRGAFNAGMTAGF